jgi:hypothetical protein
VLRASVAAIVGGTISELSGGKFANGAVMGAIAVIASNYAKSALAEEGRPLTSGERKLVMKYFGMRVNPYSVRVIEGQMFLQQDVPIAPNGNIYMAGEGCPDYSSPLCPGGTFIHEMTHVMQYQNGEQVALQGMALQFKYRALGQDVYHYDQGSKFGNLNLEQQGDYMRDQYYRREPRSPYSLLPP